MFWEKNYTPSQNIEVLLEKEGVTVEEFLDEDDIIQECKSQKKTLLAYFTRPDILRRLVELIITVPSEDLPIAQRFRHANVACEILTLGLPSLDEKLLADTEILQLLYSYLTNQPPLNPLLSSFFSKTFRTLFTKKTDQDWFLYQQMCLKLLEYLKLQNNFVDLICKHFNTPVIPDLILQMMRNVEGGQLRRNLYNWLNEVRLIEKVINVLANANECEMHANVSEFLCDLIQQGRMMRQTEQDNDSFEPAFEGSNPILKNIESATTLEALFNVILQPNAPESTIVSGITVVLKIIKPIVILDERNPDRLKFIQDREKEIHDELLNTVICVIEPHLKHFNELLRNPPKKSDIVTTATKLSPPFGMTRLQICRLFTVLLQTNNEDISKAICEIDFFETLLDLFKQYCWNNFLHSEVEKCLQTVFYTSLAANNNNNSTHASDGSQNKHNTMSDNYFDNNNDNIFNMKPEHLEQNEYKHEQEDHQKEQQQLTTVVTNINDLNNTNQSNNPIYIVEEVADKAERSIEANKPIEAEKGDNKEDSAINEEENENHSVKFINENNSTLGLVNTASHSSTYHNDDNYDNDICKDEAKIKLITSNDDGDTTSAQQNVNIILDDHSIELDNNLDNVISSPKNMESKEIMNIMSDNNEQDISTKAPINVGPSKLQTHVIVNCKIICKLVNCWQHNREAEEGIKGRRLGYMGHLIQIFKHINNCITESEQIGALIENNFQTNAERELWQSIVNKETGDLSRAIKLQNQLLANCNAHEACDYNISLDFLTDTDLPDAFNNLCVDELGGASSNNMDDDGDDNVEDADFITPNNDGNLSIYGKTSSLLSPFSVTNNPWEMNDDFNMLKTTTVTSTTKQNNNTLVAAWTTDFGTDNFADFDAHFSSFNNDLGDPFTTTISSNNTPNTTMGLSNINNTNNRNTAVIGEVVGSSDTNTFNYMINTEEYDNNVNVNAEKLSSSSWPIEFTGSTLNKSPSTFVGCNFIDDYENDDGMWTKPLGGSHDVVVNPTTTMQSLSHDIAKDEEIVAVGVLKGSLDPNVTNNPTTNGPVYTHNYASTILNAQNMKLDRDETGEENQVVNNETQSNSDNELLNNLAKIKSGTIANIASNEHEYFSDDNNNEDDENGDNFNEINLEAKPSMHNFIDAVGDTQHKFLNKNVPIETIVTTSTTTNNIVENFKKDILTTATTAAAVTVNTTTTTTTTTTAATTT